MRRTAALIYAQTGQTLSVRIPDGMPTSATFAVYRQYTNDDATAEFSGTATVSTVNTTITASAGPSQTDPRLLTLTVTGIAAGSRYLLAQNSVKEWVDVVEVGATTIRVRFPLQHSYTTGATFQGCTLTAAVDATWIAQIYNISNLVDTAPDFRVKWTVIVGGATIVVYSFFDVVRTVANHHVTIADVNERAFGLMDSLPVEYREEAGQPLVEAGWRAVRAHLLTQSIQPDSWRNDEAMDELVVLRSLRNLAEGGWHPVGTDLEQWRKTVTDNYDRFFEQHIVTLKHPTSTQLDSAIAFPFQAPPARNMWSK